MLKSRLSRASQIDGERKDNEWWRPDALLPALVIIGPYFLNKLIYFYFPGYLVFVATDYACRTFSLAFLYLLLRRKPISLPIPWRLNVVGLTFIQYLNAHSWRLTRFPSPNNSVLQYFDNAVGMLFVGLTEEAVFRFYLMNLLLLRGMSPTLTIIVSTLIFGGIHWSYGVGAMVFSTLAGLVLSLIYAVSRNLIVPIVVHAAYDTFFFAGGVAFLWRVYNRVW
jgi:membrane protease YdiL (CAAX protease family)